MQFSMYNIQELSTEAISWTRRMTEERMILHLEKNTQHTHGNVDISQVPSPHTTVNNDSKVLNVAEVRLVR